jgi:high-affinity iron transporter
MASFSHLPAEDRWALAFYVGRFAFTDAEAAEGKRLWDGDPAVRAAFPDLAALTQTTPAELATRLGEPRARALTAYLRRHPEAAARPAGSTLTLARTRLAESEAAYRRAIARPPPTRRCPPTSTASSRSSRPSAPGTAPCCAGSRPP